ncbi:MAG: DNA repair protein RecO [Leptolyngbyaceae cyanobacterium]
MSVSIPGKSYKATGITLKSSPMGESDRLLTILTREHGVVRVVTPGCRKPKSSLRAISSAFVTGELLIIKGRNLDKLVQADCRGSFPGLSRDLGKLTAAQYLAELVLSQALSDQPQEELFTSLHQHLAALSHRPPHQTLPYLVYSIFTLLVAAGVAPQVQRCGMNRQTLVPNLADPGYQAEFDIAAGQVNQPPKSSPPPVLNPNHLNPNQTAAEAPGHYGTATSSSSNRSTHPRSRPIPLSGLQLWVLQQLSHVAGAGVDLPRERAIAPRQASSQIPSPAWLSLDDLLDAHLLNLEYLQAQGSPTAPPLGQSTTEDGNEDTDSDHFLDEIFPINRNLWLTLERVLRQYCHYHFDQPIRSAALIQTCFPETVA